MLGMSGVKLKEMNSLKINEAMEYIKEQAKMFGYSERQISYFEHEIREKVYLLEDWTKEDLDNLVEEFF